MSRLVFTKNRSASFGNTLTNVIDRKCHNSRNINPSHILSSYQIAVRKKVLALSKGLTR